MCNECLIVYPPFNTIPNSRFFFIQNMEWMMAAAEQKMGMVKDTEGISLCGVGHPREGVCARASQSVKEGQEFSGWWEFTLTLIHDISRCAWHGLDDGFCYYQVTCLAIASVVIRFPSQRCYAKEKLANVLPAEKDLLISRKPRINPKDLGRPGARETKAQGQIRVLHYYHH